MRRMAPRSISRRAVLGQVGAAFVPHRDATNDPSVQGRDPSVGDPPPARVVPRVDLEHVRIRRAGKTAPRTPAFSAIAGSQRAPLDRITLHPRMCVPVLEMDLRVSLFRGCALRADSRRANRAAASLSR